ncbi:MAG TPA: glycosyltransferase family 2 protein [Kiritimatiellia bacterium]|nr:glycosyltransferase family 2 protein [Kiritimatiellia bacterium]
MKIVALLFIYNESHVIRKCLDHLVRQGIHFFVTDNGSTDGTREIVLEFKDRGLIGCDNYPRGESFEFKRLLLHKAKLARDIDADWFIHHDADEFRMSNLPGETLHDAVCRIDALGFNAINFQEFTFIPTVEHPHHEPDTFLATMKWYYPFLPRPLHRVNVWKNGYDDLDFISSGGHWVQFKERRIYPESLSMRHYMYISLEQFLHKYRDRRHHPEELERGWHGWREQANESTYFIPSESQLKVYDPDQPWRLDARNPLHKHLISHSRMGNSAPTPPG